MTAQETNVGAPHGAIRARQGEDDAAAVMTTGGGVGRKWLTDAEIQAMYRRLNLPPNCYIHRSGKIYEVGGSFPKGAFNGRT